MSTAAARSHFRYLTTFAVTAALLATAVTMTNFRAIFVEPANQSAELVQFQKRKLAAARDITTLFVGDSSLGNSLDAALYSRLSGEKALNLALTGGFGYEGTYNMIKAAADCQPLRRVVIIQTVDLLTREPWPDGYLYSANSPADFLELHPRDMLEYLDRAANILLSWRTLQEALDRHLGRGPKQLEFAGDYPRQSTPLTAERMANARIAAPPRLERIAWLRKIARFCAARGIRLSYLHGPLNAAVYENSGSYISVANSALEASGIPFDPAILLLPPEETGDAFDHVRPGFKPHTTRKYLEKIRALDARPALPN